MYPPLQKLIEKFRELHRKHRRGMTMIELMLALGIVSTLFTMTASQIDVAEIFLKLGKTEEQIAVRVIGRALDAYKLDYQGELPSGITSVSKPICKETTTTLDCSNAGGVEMTVLTVNQVYLPGLPVHTTFEADAQLLTGYQVLQNQNGRVRVISPNSEIFYEN